MRKISLMLAIVALTLVLGLSIGLAQSNGGEKIYFPLLFKCCESDAVVIEVTKTANPTLVTVPGGEVTFTVTVENDSTSGRSVDINSLIDDVHGDLHGQGSCTVPQTIPPGGSYTCEFTATVRGEVGYTENDTITASGTDNQDYPVTDSDSASVLLVDVIKVIKTAHPNRVIEPGGEVTFTVKVENNFGPRNPVEITALIDDIHGDLNGQGNCSVPQAIQPGDSYTCQFSAMVSGNVGDVEIDTVTASGQVCGNAGDVEIDTVDSTDSVDCCKPISYSGSAQVEIIGCEITEVEGTIGFEDLPNDESNDYDYNDWITDIFVQLDYLEEPRCDLQAVTFSINPEGRGATFEHNFHLLIPGDIFGSDGIATLSIYDQNNDLVSSSQTPFIASTDNDYLVIPLTSEAFPSLTNTIEGQEPPMIPSGRNTILSIEFDTPAPFSADYFMLTDPHGTGLFFDPYLHVVNWDGYIHIGDFNTLVFPEIDVPWPEERIRIDQAFPDVTFDPGPPINIDFPEDWWLNFNDCVYNGVTCPLTPAP